MGSSENGGLGVLDSRIGSIVWVRRRNGSWWPGKILATDELSASHLMSPRSGTPVKLLGREDASVDWYNLEKSKRVKTFRCGEFDDCIERAEASIGLPAKKREKYARREDAILHALELEKEIIEKNSGKDLHTTSGDLRNGNGGTESMELEHERNINLVCTQNGEGGAWQNLNNSESNALIGGSQDFILRKKLVASAVSPLHKATSDDQVQAVPAGRVCGDVDSGNSADKRKRSLDMSNEESSIKKYDRRRPLVHVLQNNTTWPGHSLQPEGDSFSMTGVNNQVEDAQKIRHRLLYMQSQFTDIMDIKGDPFGQLENLAPLQGVGMHSCTDTFQKDATSESSEDTESDPDLLEADSMVHYDNVEMIRNPDEHTTIELQATALNGLEQQGYHASSGSEKYDKSFSHDITLHHQKSPVSLDVGISRWKIKGKRNVRNFSRRFINKFARETYLEPGSSVQRSSRNLIHSHGLDGYNNEANSNMADLEELKWRDSSFGGYWGDGFGSSHAQELLLDVALKLQANNRREHVPFVSLMSRLNGKPIIGHPIQIETLGDGSTDSLFSSTDAYSQFQSDATNSHQPSQSAKPVSAKKKNFARRISHQPRKKSSSSSIQKTRPLSSLGINQNLVSEPKHTGVKRHMDGAIKPADCGPPTVSCIPVKLVFSRLLEAIGRPASVPTSH